MMSKVGLQLAAPIAVAVAGVYIDTRLEPYLHGKTVG